MADQFHPLGKNEMPHISEWTALREAFNQSGAQQIPLSEIPESFQKDAQLTFRLMYPAQAKTLGAQFLAYFIPEEKNGGLPFLLIEPETGFWTTGSEYFLAIFRAAAAALPQDTPDENSADVIGTIE